VSSSASGGRARCGSTCGSSPRRISRWSR
jgi:hypothetical protein